MPEAYKIGWVPFIHANVYLDSKPLIPRTETEYWVDKVIKEIDIPNPKILDLCAGSGCIGVAVLKEIFNSTVDFVEIDQSHHKTIRRNIKENGIDMSRIWIFDGDLFQNIKDTYDVILSNPPYINPKLLSRVEESVINYEPSLALLGGKDGIEIINKILNNFSKYLKPNGYLYLEHEPEQVNILKRYSFYVDSYQDQYGVLRFSKFQNKL